MPEPKRIPIYDETASIACTITDAEIPERLELIERLRAAMTSVERTPTGLLLHFPEEPVVRADLDRFAIDEKRCCAFWEFAVVDEHRGVALRWDGPRAAEDLLAQLEVFFTTDAPISVLDGLL